MKKQSEYTKLKKETIVGIISFLMLATIVYITIETISQMWTQRTIWAYPVNDSVFTFWLAIILSGVFIFFVTMIVFIVLYLIGTTKGWIPEIEGHIEIWNPFNKTRFVINRKSERPQVVYYLRRPHDWIKLSLPEWIEKRLDKIILPALLIGLISILWLNNTTNPEWIRIWIGFPLNVLFLVFTCYLIFYIITSETWPNKRAVVTQEEYDEMIPHLNKLDKIVFGSTLECYYKSRMWIVSQEDYDNILQSLTILEVIK